MGVISGALHLGASGVRLAASTIQTPKSPHDGAEVGQRFDHVEPNGAPYAYDLLHLVLVGNEQMGGQLPLLAKRRPRMAGRHIYLRAAIQPIEEGSPLHLDIFAEPYGTALHCGWHVYSYREEDAYSQVPATATKAQRRINVDRSAEGVHALARITSAFDEAVFTPALQQVADAIGRPGGGTPPVAGFLGLQ